MNLRKKRLSLILCLFLIFSSAVGLLPQGGHVAGSIINIIQNVPAFDWTYGCSATSAAMLFGYYDRIGYDNMYTGPENGGVCPLDNSVWGHTKWPSNTICGECPLSATHRGIDRAQRGHVDDYWKDYGKGGPDPYLNNWVEHVLGDCTGDYMGTNQAKYGNDDGQTTFYSLADGTRLYDYTGAEPAIRDGCHGMRLFAESRGYRVLTCFSQVIKGQGVDMNGRVTDKGFTFTDFQAEVDASRPVLIQLSGHTMVGYGYDSSDNTVYIQDTWDHDVHTMKWGGKYSGLQHEGVTVIRLAPPYGPMVAAGGLHTVGLKSDRTVVATGHDDYGQSSNIEYWGDILQVAAGTFHTVGLVADGTVVAAGWDDNHQCAVGEWTSVVQVAGGSRHTVGLKQDRTVLAVGTNALGQCSVWDWADIVQVAAGYDHTVGLTAYTTVVAAGDDSYGQCNVSGWSDIVQVAAGGFHTVALEADGTVVAVGDNTYGQCNVSGWRNIVQIAAGCTHTVGLTGGGNVVAVGDDSQGQCNLTTWAGIVQVTAGCGLTVGLRFDGPVFAAGLNDNEQRNVGSWDLN